MVVGSSAIMQLAPIPILAKDMYIKDNLERFTSLLSAPPATIS